MLVDRLHRRRVRGAVVAGEREQPGLRFGDGHGVIEDLPVAGLDLAMQPLGQLRGDVPQGVDSAALLVSEVPQLSRGLPDPGGSVGDDQRRGSHPTGFEVAAEIEPVLITLAATELQAEQHFTALQRDPPRDQDPLGGLVVGAQLQIDRVEIQVREIMLAEVTLAPGRIPGGGVLADSRDGRPADHLLPEALLQSSLDITDRQPPQEAANDQRLQRVRSRDTLAEYLTLEPHPARVANPRTLDHGRTARRPNRAWLLKPVAVDHLPAAVNALIPRPADELRHLILERLLQDQPGAEPRDRLHRILLLADPGQDFIKLVAQPFAGDYLLHAGVPPSASTCRSKRRLRPPYFPRPWDGTA